ncbi:MAG TPA: DUF5818 domain-containing protein [Terracidiphilus sp.]|jgi:hypothetical protein|nr:DUF5818 domain-containing protein [Terracidiphilus sp.]
MRIVRFVKRDLFRDLLFGIAVSTFVFLCALAWGSPFISTASFGEPVQMRPTPARSAALSGTVVRDGSQFMLRDGAGQVYRLDNPNQVQLFEGKSVKVTGVLDSEARLIHVEQIESPAA